MGDHLLWCLPEEEFNSINYTNKKAEKNKNI
jgi:hypothetical protein